MVLASGPPVRQLPALLLPLLLPLLLLPLTAPALWTDASGVGSVTRPAVGVSVSSRRRGEELCCVPAGTRSGRKLRHGRWPVPNLYMTLHGTVLPPAGNSCETAAVPTQAPQLDSTTPSSLGSSINDPIWNTVSSGTSAIEAQRLDASGSRWDGARIDDEVLGMAGSQVPAISVHSTDVRRVSERTISGVMLEGNNRSSTVAEACLVESAPSNAQLTRVEDGGTISTEDGDSEAGAAEIAGT